MSYRLTHIYVLNLICGKIYIGESEDPDKRFYEHCYEIDPYKWTALYAPINFRTIFYNMGRDSLSDIIILYMWRFGINNVRGGKYKNSHLQKYYYDELVHLTNKNSYINELISIYGFPY